MTSAYHQLPPRSGLGLKAKHYRTVMDDSPETGWFEVHPENYMGAGGLPHRYLTEIHERYPLSMHGVGLSLGSADGIDDRHLNTLRELVHRYRPEALSEHLAWNRFDSVYVNDLLPVPYHEESLRVFADNIDKAQETLGRPIMIENPSVYVGFVDHACAEPEFLTALASRTGCGLLLDVNNVFVSACNLGFDPCTYIKAVPPGLVGEIHLSGHAIQLIQDTEVRIDDHGSPVKQPVWELYEFTLRHLGRYIPTLIEWDTDVPALHVLLAEAARADAVAAEAKRPAQQAAMA
ncbi:MAG: DUF692 domain-containing protein [Gammaproteobacteria bacterium]